jgi:hypothetical protein
MASRKPHYTPDTETIFRLAREAWALSPEQIQSIQPGALGLQQLRDLLDVPRAADRPLAPKDRRGLDNPHLHLLRVMRDPEFFPFTCRQLFVRPDGAGPLRLMPFQHLALKELWWRQFPMLVASRGAGKSFLLGLYALLRATFTPGAKVIITAAAFRQAKAVFDYMERIWHHSPVFRSLVNSGGREARRKNGPRRDIDRVEFVIGDSVVIGLPLGDGQKIRGLRANYILTDEVASIPEEVYATVVQGFASVTADPVGNVMDHARVQVLKRLALWTAEMDAEEAKKVRGNQSVLSGTAYYAFNHFCRYWREYKAVIETRGDPRRLEEVLKGPAPEGYRYDQYSVFRLPYGLIPHGYMDASTVSRAKQITNTSQFGMEYEAVFQNDSEGFFKRSLIEKCVVGRPGDETPPTFPSCGRAVFTAAVRGNPKFKYVYAVDPASERDNLAVTVLEIWPDHRRVVYCWTTGKNDHRKKLKQGMVKEHNFYVYAVRKIRDLMRVFPCDRLMVDSGGGGIALREALGDPDKLQDGEQPIYERIVDGEEKDTDQLRGEHILELVHFRDNAWVTEANEGLKKDLEERQLLFPLLDALALGQAELEDEAAGRVATNEDGQKVFQTYDTLESAMLEIEDMKDELATIVVSETATGLRRWDTPDVKTAGSKPGRMRKDRYSALLMANMAARQMARALPAPQFHETIGGFAGRVRGRGKPDAERLFHGPAWYTDAVDAHGGGYGAVVRRGGV